MQFANTIRYICFIVFSFLLTPITLASTPFTFATLGDTQDITEQGQARIADLIRSINEKQPEFTVHIGELKGGKDVCDDAYYQRIANTAKLFDQPLIYLPGDNDWTDCFHSQFDPIERLAYLRKLLYLEPMSLGKTVIPLNQQSKQKAFRNYPENLWWQHNEVLFATFHNVGTNNNLYSNTHAIEEHMARNTANLAWLDHVFETGSNAKALVIFTHANIKFNAKSWEPTGFDTFRDALSQHVRKFNRPVLFIHGDTHEYKIDKPLKYKGKTVSNFTRLEVFGSPDLGAIYVHIDPKTEHIFRFEPFSYDFLQ